MNDDIETAARVKHDAPAGNRYVELTALREAERADAMRRGLIDDPSKPKALEDASTFEGTCLDKCPLYEREQREYQNNVERWELDPDTGRISRYLAVKAFHRPAAGNEQSLPSDVRPPSVLVTTLDYLFNELVSGSESFDAVHGFVRDRTRSVRQDFTVQNSRGIEAILCHERIARFHMISLHYMSQAEGFSAQQEMEQLRKTLQSLAEYYDDNTGNAAISAHEAEFRAYHILIRARDSDVLRHIQNLPRSTVDAPIFQHALAILMSLQRSNEELGRFKSINSEGALNLYSRFFALIRSPRTTFVMACLCESLFTDVRRGALKALRKSFIAAHKGLNATELMHLLAMDAEDDVALLCEAYGINMKVNEDGQLRAELNKTTDFNDDGVVPILRSSTMIDSKRGQLRLSALIDGEHYHGKTPQPEHPALAFTTTSSSITQQTKSIIPEARAEPLHYEKPSQTAATTQIKMQTEVDMARQAEPLLNQMFTETVNTVVDRMLQNAVEQQLVENRRRIAHQEDILRTLADELLSGLILDTLHSIAASELATAFYKRHVQRRALRHIKTVAKRSRQISCEKARVEALEAARIRSYANAFASISPSTAHNRHQKRVKRIEASSDLLSGVENVRQISKDFWKPLDLRTCKWSFLEDDRGDVQTLLLIAAPESSAAKWMTQKFDFTPRSDSKVVQIGQTKLEVAMNVQYQPSMGNIIMLVFTISSTQDMLHTHTELLRLLRVISRHSRTFFTLLILSFSDTPVSNIEEELQLKTITSDPQSPIRAFEVVSLLNLQDVKVFELAFKRVSAQTTTELAPLAVTRDLMEKAKVRQDVDTVKSSRKTNTSRAQARSGFFDHKVAPLAQLPTIEASSPRIAGDSASLKSLKQSLREAEELLNQSQPLLL